MKSDKKIAIMVTAIMVILVSAFAMPASAADKYLCEQVSEEGFGDLTNDYAWSMANFSVNGTPYLYVGTLNTNLSSDLFDPANWSNTTDGCEIWRTNGTEGPDGKYIWEQVVGPTGTQFIIPPIGITSPATAGFGTFCIGARGMEVYENLLWVGTSNPAVGAQVWVTNGTHWKLANIPGFGNASNTSTRGITAFKDHLYVGTMNPKEGAGVLRYNGSTDFASIGSFVNLDKWEQVNVPGFGEPETNLGVGELVTFNASEEYLYVGTWNGTGPQLIGAIFNDWNFSSLVGCQVWRTNGTVNASDPPRFIWEQVEDNGFGDPLNGGILSSAVFNGKLYMGTQNFVDQAEIWRTSDGTTWDPVTETGFLDIWDFDFRGFGNGYIWDMFVYNNSLFVGTLNPILGCQIWKSSTGDPGTFEQVNVNGMNGERKIPITSIDNFSITGIDQYGVRSFAEFNGNLHLGTASFGDWIDKIIEQGSGESSNYSEYVGCEVWRTNGTTYIPPKIEVAKTVWDSEKEEWVKELNASINDTVRFRCELHNNGISNLTNISVWDFLSCSLEYADDATQDPYPVMNFTMYGPTLGTLLVWNLTDIVLTPGENITIEYNASVVQCGIDVNFLFAGGHYKETEECGYGWDYVIVHVPIPSGFVRISEGGFIDSESEGRHNSYAWSMDVLPTPNADYLYVGCNRDFIYPLIKSLNFTDEEIEEIFEGDIPIPVPLEPPCSPAPGWPPIPDSRGRLFRCQGHDPNTWELAYISPIVAHPNPAVPCPIPRYTGYRAMRTFTDVEGETALYVATTNRPVFPCHILKFGQDYVPGDEPEIVGEFPGINSVRSLIVHDGKLYAAAFGGVGEQIWESDTPALGNWTQVAQPSDFPLSDDIPPGYPRAISAMVSFNGCLYVFVGVPNLPPGFHPDSPYDVNGVPGGFWVYKSASPAIGNWTEIMSYGAGNHWNEGVSDAKVFGDYVYLGTAISVVKHSGRLVELEGNPKFAQYLLYLLQNWKGGDVLRFNSTDNWELVIGDPCKNTEFAERVGNHGAGFCNPCNVYVWWMEVYQDELYVGTFDSCVFLKYIKNILSELCPDKADAILSEIELPECAKLLIGADLWVTEDGTCWNPVTLNGFGNNYNYGVRSLAATDEDLFVGTANPFYGAEVWWKAHPEGEATGVTGKTKDVYYTDEIVYATGSGFVPNSALRIYITEDKHWEDGMEINSTVYRNVSDVPVDGDGNITGFEMWPNPIPGEYDMVFDANRNGFYDVGVDAVDHPAHPGFIVLGRVPTLTPIGIVALMGLLTIIATSVILRRKKR